MNLAVIPARGGSKRIPRKNIRLFHGRPIIAWPICAAIETELFDRIIVSTDDNEVASIALDLGAEVPFVRPSELSGDFVATIPVIKHAIEQSEKLWGNFAHVCCIYATNPFIRASDLRLGLECLKGSEANFSFPVTEYPYPISRALKLDDGAVKMIDESYLEARSQDLSPAYHDAGQFYWGTSSAFKNESTILGSRSAAIVLPRHRVIDIDTEEDWNIAEKMFATSNKN